MRHPAIVVTAAMRKRFEKYIYCDPNSGCFIWFGSCHANGYGHFSVDNRVYKAHRVAWVLAGRDLPAEGDLIHKCDISCCVNPDHLTPGSHFDNMNDMAMKGRGRQNRGALPFGVRRSKSGRFNAVIVVGGKQIHVGSFSTAGEATDAAQERKMELRGGCHR